MPPNARTVADVHRETGVSEPTLYALRREFQNRGHAVPRRIMCSSTIRICRKYLREWVEALPSLPRPTDQLGEQ